MNFRFNVKKIALYLLVLSLPFQSALAQDVLYQATTTKILKFRATSSNDAKSIGSIPADTELPILGIEGESFKVLYRNREGYVNAKCFKDFRSVLPQPNYELVEPNVNEELMEDDDDIEESSPSQISEPTQSVSLSNFDLTEPFTPRYVAKNTDTALLYKQPDENSDNLTIVPKYSTDLVLSQIRGPWALAKFNDKVGFIKTKLLVQYDFLDPYAERFPGIINYNYAAVLPMDTPVYDQKNLNKVHKVIPAGSVIGVETPDDNGYMHVAYMKRKQGLIKKSEAINLVPVVPYDTAQKGDLISIFTTFFPTHNSNLQIIGRVYNIYLSSDILSGHILQPGEKVSMNKLIGPYKKQTGYMKAPIASKVVATGYGGGTCQVNTTTYNSLLQVPMLVSYRRVHSKSGAVYIPIGFDAAVGSLASVDMKFENTLPYPVLLKYYISENILTTAIYRAE